MNILLDRLDMDQPWGFDYFRNIIRPDMRVTYLPLAFHEDWIHDAREWEEWYGKYEGSHYQKFTKPFTAFGINEDNINYVNYYTDNPALAAEKINGSDIIIFSGGMPDKIIEHLQDMQLMETIDDYTGIIMGWSAGSMMQCEDYYISPDEDIPVYKRCNGLKRIKGFAVEVHYQGSPQQKESIERYIEETGNTVYITSGESAIIVDDSRVQLIGNVKTYIKDKPKS